MITQDPPVHLLRVIDQSLTAIETRLKKLENQKLPTFPRRPPELLPDVGIFGQIAVGDDDLMYGFNGITWTDCNA